MYVSVTYTYTYAKAKLSHVYGCVTRAAVSSFLAEVTSFSKMASKTSMMGIYMNKQYSFSLFFLS